MNKLLNRLWCANILCCTGIAISTIYEMTNIASLLFYVSFLVTAASLYLCLNGRVSLYVRNTVLVLIFIMLLALISVLQGGMSFAYLKKFIIYMTTLSSYFIALKFRPTTGTVKLLLGSNAVVSIMYILRSQAEGAYIQDTLWLFFSNPNFAGMWLFMSTMLLVVTLFFVKKTIWRIPLVAGTAYLVYLCFQTGSRNIWFALVYAVALCAVCLLAKTHRFKKWMLFAINLYPLLFVFCYMFLTKKGLISEGITDMLVSEGKPITSRYIIWKEAFSYIGKRPLFGAYSLVGGGSGSFQLHNTHIDTWAAYGTVGLILFLVYIYRIMKEANDSCNTKAAMFALAGFMCMTLMGSAEASLYSTGMGMYIYVSSFLLLANYWNQQQQHEGHISVN